nr:PREDICTED: uncharacterized protein LOC109040177 isoform X3 [Bemisia tabaci]
MEPSLAQLLTEWGLPRPVLQKFEANDITSCNHLMALQVEDVQEMLTIGQKVLFRQRLQRWQADSIKSKQTVEEGASSSVNSERNISDDTIELMLDVHNVDDIRTEFQVLTSPVAKRTPPRNSKRQEIKSPATEQVSRSLIFETSSTSSSTSTATPSTSSSTFIATASTSSSTPIVKPDASVTPPPTHLTTTDSINNLLKSSNAGLIILADGVEFACKSLEQSAEHYDTTLNHWIKSHSLRIQTLQKEDGDANVNW